MNILFRTLFRCRASEILKVGPFLGSLFIAAILAGAVPGTALAQGSPALHSKAAEAGTLLARAARPDGVRVIVTLKAATRASEPRTSSSTRQGQVADRSGPLQDGQVATVEQARVIARHLGGNVTKRQRWSPRLIANTPYVAMTVRQSELEALAADPDVVRIHEDGQMQPGLQNSVPLIGMPAAHADGGTGTGTMVAVLDTGVEYGHVFLTPQVTNATCRSTNSGGFATLCPNGQTSQIGGTAGINCGVAGCNHGTHVAGIAAGSQASGTPLDGVAKSATIFSGQVFSRRTSDNALVAFDSDLLASLNDLLTRVSPGGELNSRKMAAVNISIWDAGFEVAGNCDTVARGIPFKTVIDNFAAQNVATVIISGNGSKSNLSAFPGCISSAVTVSSTTKSDLVSDFSNVSAIVDLFAPGTNITSSVPPTPAFAVLSGTSMAAPHVAGAFSAIRSACPAAITSQIETALKNTGILIQDDIHAKPRIRVDQAINQLCPENFTIEVSGAPQRGTVQGAGTFLEGSSRTVRAIPKLGFRFANWTENGAAVSASRIYTFILTDNRDLVAHFAPKFFTIEVSGAPQRGTVRGAGSFREGSSRTVTATPKPGYRFLNWRENGAAVSASKTYTFILTRDRELVAHFKKKTSLNLEASLNDPAVEE